MRIGIDATALPDQPVGAGVYIIQLIRALAAEQTGHELVVFAQRSGRNLIGDELPGLEWVTVGDNTPARRLIWEQTLFPILVRRARIDLLHSLHYTRPVLLNCASVVTVHDMTFFLYPELHLRAKRVFFPLAIRLSGKLADVLLASSESTRLDALRLLKLPPQKIITVPLGVDESFHPVTDAALLEACRSRYHLPEQFILYVGLIEPRKNLTFLLQAYSRLVSEGDAPPLVAVGRSGWMVSEVLQQIETLKLKDRVIFTGYIPAPDLPIVYNLARVMVYPSLYEGFGLPPLEAMACGTPVITSAVSSLPEHVGEAGILVPPQDEAALTQAMRQVLGDPDLQRQLSVRGQARAQQYTWKRTAQETLKAYQQVWKQVSARTR